MSELSPEIVTIIMMVGVVVGVLSGYPLAIPLGAIGLIVGYALFGSMVFNMYYMRMFSILTSYPLLALPLFMFMGFMIERSGIAEKMYEALYLWLSGFRGGLAIVSVVIGTILAATVGIITAAIVLLAVIALPAMIKRGYDKGLASGSIIAAGCLGTLIPPSIMLIIYGPMAMISVGKLFMGAIGPGLLLSGLYISYIAIRSFLQPKIAPSVPAEDRAAPFREKTIKLFTSVAPVALIIVSVLGVIFLGIAPPTEAAAVGAFAATLLAIAYRKFSFSVLKETTLQTFKLSGMMYLIGTCSVAFVGVFMAAGSGDVVANLVLSAPFGRWGGFAIIMLTIFLLGFVIEWLSILFIMVPIISPIVVTMGFDPLWFGIMVMVNLQAAYMTPPMAGGIFYLRAAAPPELGVTIADMIRGLIPFVILIMVGLGLLIAFPQIILWLPGVMIK